MPFIYISGATGLALGASSPCSSSEARPLDGDASWRPRRPYSFKGDMKYCRPSPMQAVPNMYDGIGDDDAMSSTAH
jgi:hypothetical protein